MNVGILGGTFDPIHLGHIAIAEEARVKLNLSRVLFIPAGQPWLKADRDVTAPAHRVEMVKLAIEVNPCFELSTVEVDRSGPSYVVDTVDILRQQMGPEIGLFFLLGWDSLAELHRWKEPTRIVQMCKLVAVPRPTFDPPDVRALDSLVPGIGQSVILLDMPQIDMSSSEIRKMVAAGLSIHDMVPEEVEKYIEEKKLYC